MSKAVQSPDFAQFEAARAAQEEKLVANDAAALNRFLVSGMLIEGVGNIAPYSEIEPLKIYPLVERTLWERGTGTEGQEIPRSSGGIEQVLAKVRGTKIQPGVASQQLRMAYGRKGDTEGRDRGLRELTPLTGEEDLVEVFKVQQILFDKNRIQPEKDDDLYNRVVAYQHELIQEYGPDSKIGQCAAIVVEAVEQGREWKLQHFRALAEDAVTGGRSGVMGAEVRWRKQLNVELPPELTLAGALPGDADYKNKGGKAMSSEAEAAIIALAKNVQGPQVPENLDAIVAEKAQAIAEQMFAKFLESQATGKGKK